MTRFRINSTHDEDNTLPPSGGVPGGSEVHTANLPPPHVMSEQGGAKRLLFTFSEPPLSGKSECLVLYALCGMPVSEPRAATLSHNVIGDEKSIDRHWLIKCTIKRLGTVWKNILLVSSHLSNRSRHLRLNNRQTCTCCWAGYPPPPGQLLLAAGWRRHPRPGGGVAIGFWGVKLGRSSLLFEGKKHDLRNTSAVAPWPGRCRGARWCCPAGSSTRWCLKTHQREIGTLRTNGGSEHSCRSPT